MTAGRQTVLILQQRVVLDQYLAVKSPPVSQEAIHPENSPSLSRIFPLALDAKKRRSPNPEFPAKPANPQNCGNSKISEF
jgi:hypothetical protein